MLTLQVISDALEFKALEVQWNGLADKFANPLLRFDWFDACWCRYKDRAELAVFVARGDGGALAIAPLVVDRSVGIPNLRALAHETTEPNGFLYADETSLAAVSAAILNQRKPVMLSRIGVDSEEARVLRGSPRRRGLLLELPQSTATARIRLNGWRALETMMSANSRSFIRRKRKLAEREGSVTFDVVSPDETTVDRYLDEVFRVEAAGWKSQTGTAILKDPVKHRFWMQYGRAAARRRILRLFFLRIGAATAATRLTVEFGNRLWELKIGYDERWSKCSPGILLMQETLRYACEHGLDAYEFLGNLEPWQQRWPLELDHHATIGFYPLSPAGGLMLGYDACRFVAKRIYRIRQSSIRAARQSRGRLAQTPSLE